MWKRSVSSYVLVFASLVFLTLGVASAFEAGGLLREWRRLSGYAQTTGTVRATDVQVQGKYAEFIPVASYDYSVGGRSYTGNRIELTPIRTHSLSAAQGVMGHLTMVTVWYDPSAPARSVLLKSNSGGLGDVVMMPVAMLGLGTFLGVISIVAFRPAGVTQNKAAA
jgi:hypothetical protein